MVEVEHEQVGVQMGEGKAKKNQQQSKQQDDTINKDNGEGIEHNKEQQQTGETHEREKQPTFRDQLGSPQNTSTVQTVQTEPIQPIQPNESKSESIIVEETPKLKYCLNKFVPGSQWLRNINTLEAAQNKKVKKLNSIINEQSMLQIDTVENKNDSVSSIRAKNTNQLQSERLTHRRSNKNQQYPILNQIQHKQTERQTKNHNTNKYELNPYNFAPTKKVTKLITDQYKYQQNHNSKPSNRSFFESRRQSYQYAQNSPISRAKQKVNYKKRIRDVKPTQKVYQEEQSIQGRQQEQVQQANYQPVTQKRNSNSYNNQSSTQTNLRNQIANISQQGTPLKQLLEQIADKLQHNNRLIEMFSCQRQGKILQRQSKMVQPKYIKDVSNHSKYSFSTPKRQFNRNNQLDSHNSIQQYINQPSSRNSPQSPINRHTQSPINRNRLQHHRFHTVIGHNQRNRNNIRSNQRQLYNRSISYHKPQQVSKREQQRLDNDSQQRPYRLDNDSHRIQYRLQQSGDSSTPSSRDQSDSSNRDLTDNRNSYFISNNNNGNNYHSRSISQPYPYLKRNLNRKVHLSLPSVSQKTTNSRINQNNQLNVYSGNLQKRQIRQIRQNRSNPNRYQNANSYQNPNNYQNTNIFQNVNKYQNTNYMRSPSPQDNLYEQAIKPKLELLFKRKKIKM